MKVSEILDRAADYLEQPGMWGQGGCLDRPGRATGNHCASTAISHIGQDDGLAANSYLAGFLALSGAQPRSLIYRWNDDPGRTLEEVLTALREAAQKARESGI